MPYLYILECGDGSYYTGSAKELESRIKKHQSGKGAKYTRSRLPVTLVYYEELESWGDTLRRESQIKQLTRSRKQMLIQSWEH